MAKTASKSFSLNNSSQSHNFCCFDVFSVRTHRIFPVQVKMLTIRPVFPDPFFVSYDYVEIEFYISHRPVPKEEEESNEIRTLYGVWRKIIEFKTFIKWISKSWNIISQLFVEYSYPKWFFTDSPVRRYQTSLSKSAHQGRASFYMIDKDPSQTKTN